MTLSTRSLVYMPIFTNVSNICHKMCKFSTVKFTIKSELVKLFSLYNLLQLCSDHFPSHLCQANVSIRMLILARPGNTKGGSITVPLTSCLTGLDQSVLQIKTKNVSCHTADSKPVKQEVNGTVMWYASKNNLC